MALTYAVLEATRAPATVEALARRLAVPVPHVRAMLDALERRGYVRRLDGPAGDVIGGPTPGDGSAWLACGPTACGGCAFRTACGVAPEVRWQRVADDASATSVNPPPAP